MYAYMLTRMNVGQLVANARESSQIAIRKLAEDADVAGSTITRIQSGAVDPSLQTLDRILRAAGFELHVTAVRRGAARHTRLEDLVDAWTTHRGQVRLDWTRWRTALDSLALHPERIAEAIFIPPPPSGNRIVDALLAGVAEKLADDAGLPRPTWAEFVPTVAPPYVPAIARSVQGRTIPPQLEARGLLIDTESLWRARETIGV